jgi:type VI secretion system protein ImpF
MAKSEGLNITPSLLDRLIDDDPDVSREPLPKRFQDVSQLKKSVARDLEALLNTRRETLEELPEEFIELNHALVMYGLPDFTSFNLLSHRDRNRIRRVLEQTIEIFEPRLERIRVLLEDQRANDRVLRFRIEALLHVEPAPEPVTFDAVLRLNTQEYMVRGQA